VVQRRPGGGQAPGIWSGIDGSGASPRGCGQRISLRFAPAGPRVEDLDLVAITHFHTDHVAELPSCSSPAISRIAPSPGPGRTRRMERLPASGGFSESARTWPGALVTWWLSRRSGDLVRLERRTLDYAAAPRCRLWCRWPPGDRPASHARQCPGPGLIGWSIGTGHRLQRRPEQRRRTVRRFRPRCGPAGHGHAVPKNWPARLGFMPYRRRSGPSPRGWGQTPDPESPS